MSARAPDPIWDVFVELFGGSAVGIERGRWNKACKSLREAEATPDQLRSAALAYRQHWPGITMTPLAIAANWTILTGNGTAKRTGWRIVRGSHGSTHVRDPEGTDRAPAG